MKEIKLRFVLECDGDLYYSKVIKNINEIIEHNYLIDELIEDGGCNQGNIAFNDAFVDRDWIIKHTPQYTGLKDKNGVEIYEGDILKIAGDKITVDFICSIIFEDGSFGRKTEFSFIPLCQWTLLKECDVIGNIYENPELLK